MDISLPTFSFSNNETEMISAIIKALVTIKVTVKAFCFQL